MSNRDNGNDGPAESGPTDGTERQLAEARPIK